MQRVDIPPVPILEGGAKSGLYPANSVGLPLQLTSVPHWIGWRREQRGGRVTKVPYNLTTGRRASSTEPSDWLGYDEARRLSAGYDGLGFVFTKALGMTGIDLDDCLTGTVLKPWAVKILEDFNTTYAEKSPSGNGIKIWAYGNIADTGKKTFVDSDGQPCAESEADGAIEVYDTGRYFAVTGEAWAGLQVADRQTQITKLYNRVRARTRPIAAGRAVQPATPTQATPQAISEGSRHPFLLTHAAKWRDSGMDESAILIGLRELNRSRCTPPKPEQELRGIVTWLADKPPSYRLMPSDYHGSALPAVFACDTESSLPPPIDLIDFADRLLATTIAGKDASECYTPELINAIAQAGDIKQYEAKRRLRAAFDRDFSSKEFDSRVKAAKQDLRPEAGPSAYIFTAGGTILANLANAITMLSEIGLRWNSFTCRTFLTAKSPWGSIGDWTDNDDISAQEWCQRRELNIPRSTTIANAAEKIARLDAYHPVRHYLTGLRWDGEPRLDLWLTTFLGVVDTPYARKVAAKWTIEAVQRAMEAGCQADYTLVLEGAQGARKSSALRILAGSPWFSDDVTDIGSKDSAMQLQGKWIIELAELDAFKKTEATTIKAWLVRRSDFFRPPYGRRPADFPRQNVFAATTNKEDWANDDTGLRRFWPVRVGEIDLEGLEANRDQIWAEAFLRYSEGEKPYFAEHLEALAVEEQGQRQQVDPWTDQVLDWMARPRSGLGSSGSHILSTAGSIYLPDILQHCLMLHPKDQHPAARHRVGSILRLAKYKKIRSPEFEVRLDGSTWRPEYWVPVEP
ncbi:MAG: virulence-associated family protein [Bryobacterales bacterium]|nr:virulence-associated family protein [Bryobacterales bacterium]